MRIVTFRGLAAKGIPYCREQIRRKAKAGEFPSPITLSPKRVAWVESEVDDWLAERIALRDTKAA
jgi:prophage regulatory protein